MIFDNRDAWIHEVLTDLLSSRQNKVTIVLKYTTAKTVGFNSVVLMARHVSYNIDLSDDLNPKMKCYARLKLIRCPVVLQLTLSSSCGLLHPRPPVLFPRALQ